MDMSGGKKAISPFDYDYVKMSRLACKFSKYAEHYISIQNILKEESLTYSIHSGNNNYLERIMPMMIYMNTKSVIPSFRECPTCHCDVTKCVKAVQPRFGSRVNEVYCS